jgi:hypothetical protein
VRKLQVRSSVAKRLIRIHAFRQPLRGASARRAQNRRDATRLAHFSHDDEKR